MAAAQREHDAALIARLTQSGQRFSFFQAVSLLHAMKPGRVHVGELGPPGREAVRFAHSPALTFAASDVSRVSVPNEEVPAQVVTNFLGLTGASSPLSDYMVEAVLRASLDDEASLPAFYDLLHHRLLSLFYRAWRKYRFHCSFNGEKYDVGTRRLLAFVGLDTQSPGDWHALPPLVQLSFAPMLLQRTRPAYTLQVVLERLFPNVLFRVECFIARHARIDEADRVALGVRRTRLNVDMTIGGRVLDRSGRFRVVAGPVGRAAFDAFMPGGQHFALIRRVLEQFTRGLLEAELEVELDRTALVGFTLASRHGSSLGVDTHLGRCSNEPTRVRVLLSDRISEVKLRPVKARDGERPTPATGPGANS